jgi:acyl carrier protein
MPDIDRAIRAALASVAPEAEMSALAPDDDLQEVLDLDSMDFLNFLIALSHATGVDVPERDYGLVRTYQGCLDYVTARAANR